MANGYKKIEIIVWSLTKPWKFFKLLHFVTLKKLKNKIFIMI